MLIRKTFYSSIIQIGTNIAHVVFGLSLAYFFGASKDMDAYIASSNFIIALNSLLVGSQRNSLIPFISKYRDNPQQKDIIASIIKTNTLLFLLLSIIIFIFSKWIVIFLAPGLNPEQLAVSSKILKILSFYILLSNMSGIGSAILDYQYKFEKRYLLTFFQSLLAIGVLFFLVNKIGIYSTPLAHIISLAIVTIFYITLFVKNGYVFKISLRLFNNYLKEYIYLLFPILISWFFVWMIRFADVFVASFLKTGSISYLSYCQRINMYTSVIANVICSIYFPILSKLSSPENRKEFMRLFYNGFQALFTFSIAISSFIFIFSYPITKILFERGHFLAEDTNVVSSVLKYYFFVLLCAPLGAYYANTYYAYHKTKLAMLFSLISSMVNIVLNVILAFYYDVFGLAAASSIAFLVGNVLQLTNIRRVNPEYRIIILIRKSIAPLSAVAISVGIIFYIKSNWIGIPSYYSLKIYLIYIFIQACLFFLIFFSLCYLFRVKIIYDNISKILFHFISKRKH